MKQSYVGEAIVPLEGAFLFPGTAPGEPGLPSTFQWKAQRFSIRAVVEKWKETGDCRHGSGERYVRKHWYRIRTQEGIEMTIYFERQRRTRGGSRWRLYTLQQPGRSPEQVIVEFPS